MLGFATSSTPHHPKTNGFISCWVQDISLKNSKLSIIYDFFSLNSTKLKNYVLQCSINRRLFFCYLFILQVSNKTCLLFKHKKHIITCCMYTVLSKGWWHNNILKGGIFLLHFFKENNSQNRSFSANFLERFCSFAQHLYTHWMIEGC